MAKPPPFDPGIQDGTSGTAPCDDARLYASATDAAAERLARKKATCPRERPASNERTFNATVHGLRGIAAMLVFLAHMLGGVGEHIYAEVPGYLRLTLAPWNFGRWGVWLFFVISGFVILPSVLRYSPSEFALRRLLRLYPLFLAFSLVFILTNALTNAYPALNDWRAIIPALLMINLVTQTEQLTPNAWSLSYEVVFYTLCCLIVHAGLRTGNRTITLLLCVISLAFVWRYPAMAFFLGGIAVRLLHERRAWPPERLRPWLEIGTFGCCLVLASVRHYTFGHEDLRDVRTYGLFLSTIAYFYMAIGPASLSSRVLANRATAYLGTVSYSLYMCHPYTYFALRALFVQAGLFTANWVGSMALFLGCTIPLTLLFTQGVYRSLERYPYRRFFHERIFHK